MSEQINHNQVKTSQLNKLLRNNYGVKNLSEAGRHGLQSKNGTTQEYSTEQIAASYIIGRFQGVAALGMNSISLEQLQESYANYEAPADGGLLKQNTDEIDAIKKRSDAASYGHKLRKLGITQSDYDNGQLKPEVVTEIENRVATDDEEEKQRLAQDLEFVSNYQIFERKSKKRAHNGEVTVQVQPTNEVTPAKTKKPKAMPHKVFLASDEDDSQEFIVRLSDLTPSETETSNNSEVKEEQRTEQFLEKWLKYYKHYRGIPKNLRDPLTDEQIEKEANKYAHLGANVNMLLDTLMQERHTAEKLLAGRTAAEFEDKLIAVGKARYEQINRVVPEVIDAIVNPANTNLFEGKTLPIRPDAKTELYEAAWDEIVDSIFPKVDASEDESKKKEHDKMLASAKAFSLIWLRDMEGQYANDVPFTDRVTHAVSTFQGSFSNHFGAEGGLAMYLIDAKGVFLNAETSEELEAQHKSIIEERRQQHEIHQKQREQKKALTRVGLGIAGIAIMAMGTYAAVTNNSSQEEAVASFTAVVSNMQATETSVPEVMVTNTPTALSTEVYAPTNIATATPTEAPVSAITITGGDFNEYKVQKGDKLTTVINKLYAGYTFATPEEEKETKEMARAVILAYNKMTPSTPLWSRDLLFIPNEEILTNRIAPLADTADGQHWLNMVNRNNNKAANDITNKIVANLEESLAYDYDTADRLTENVLVSNHSVLAENTK